MPDFATTVLSVAMVFGPVVGYIDQYRIILQKRSSAGFNSKTCAILLFANILRIFFWLGKRFDTTLLVQSIAMIVAQMVLLHIVVLYRHDPSPTTLYSNLEVGGSSSSSLSSLLDEQLEAEIQGRDMLDHPYHQGRHRCGLLRWNGIRRFWSWEYYLDYINCLLIFTTIVAFLYLLLQKSTAFIELLGALSLGIESTLPLPQCISNFQRKSTAGFSLLVLGSWFLGDSFKLFYFIYTHAPLQFDICGGIQLSIDTAIVVQFILYSSLMGVWWKNKKIHHDDQVPVLSDDTDI
ncbi:PQ loop repeat-domain-containing protein [Halteromyces radiatus]|uniref:PQ loop repeat-domain-containing protein n=1 Tax=Halteromyces radiatus TaxID=101107 RepID=UPI00221FDD5A|nr:PQ loop repeat-domain-containing protein [Halteromyces radiatus]KAI8097107.1 PQ loop repeat-domain-containing protein [Halteromyces radiatus]